MRTVSEWIGKNDDARVPPRVAVRIRDLFNGRCGICGFPAIKPHIDHIIALCNGGENREANLQPVCRPCHAMKTKADVAIKKKTAKIAKKHLGLTKPKRKIPQRANPWG